MPFTIPNEAVAGFADQAEPDQLDLEILTAGFSHGTGSAGSYGVGPTGVQSGCAVTAQGSPDMTVAVAAGTVRIGGRRVTVTAGNVTITTASGSNPRFDLIVVDTAGAKTAIAGTAAANAVFPTITTGKVVLAAVYVPTSDTAINTNQITDKRVMIPEPPHEDVTWYGAVGNDSTDNSTAIQAAIDVAADAGALRGRGRTVFFPHGIYRVVTAITIMPCVRLLGDGHSGIGSNFGTWIAGVTSGMTVITDPEGGSVDQHGWVIEHLGIINAIGGTSVAKGLHISGTNRFRVTECFFGAQSGDEMGVGIWVDAGSAGNLDANWHSIQNVQFRGPTIGVDGFTGPHMFFCNFTPISTQGATIGVRMQTSGTDTAIHAQNGRIVGCEFQTPAGGGLGIHSQGSFVDIAACHFEGATGDTTSTHIKIEKVAGSNSQAGTRHNITACSFAKGAVAIEVGTNVTDTFIGGVHQVGVTTMLTDNGSRTTYLPSASGQVARLPTALDLPQITAPGSPASGSHRFYVDSADTTFKSKDSTGKVSVYGSRTRALFFDGSILRLDAAAGVRMGTPPNVVDGISLVNGVTSGAYFNFIMPVDVITGLIKVRPIWVPSATDGTAHTVRWQMNIKVITAADVTAAGTTVAWTGDSLARTINVEVMEAGQDSTGVSPVAADRVRLEIQRDGAHANDTYVGDVNLIGVRLDYAANN